MPRYYNYVYHSAAATYMNRLIEMKDAAGIQAYSTKCTLREIDLFLLREGVCDLCLTEDIYTKWMSRQKELVLNPRTIYQKCTVWRQLAELLSRHGHKSHIPLLPPRRTWDFCPYIFTDEQVALIFEKSDAARLKAQKFDTYLFSIPIVIRFLYGTGARLSEALSLNNEDLLLSEHYVHLKKTKNGKERLLPLSESLETALRQYLSYKNRLPIEGLVCPESPLFVKVDGTRLHETSVYKRWRQILYAAKIPFVGKWKGPRLHDLRHTFAVHVMTKLAREGIDLYTALPTLSTVLGHSSIYATEKYVRLTLSMYPELEVQCSSISAQIYAKTIVK